MKTSFYTIAALWTSLAAGTATAQTSDGQLRCGLLAGAAGFSTLEGENWQGFDVELCRLVAEVLLEDPAELTLVPVTSSERFEALASGEIDVLMSATALTSERLLSGAFSFPVVTHFGGISMLSAAVVPSEEPEADEVAAADGVPSTLCLSPGPNSLEAARYLGQRNAVEPKLIIAETSAEALEAYEAGRCEAVIGDIYRLSIARSNLSEPGAHSVEAWPITLEPLGPVLRAGDADEALARAIKWSFHGLVDPRVADDPAVTAAMPRLSAALDSSPTLTALYDQHFGALGVPVGPNAAWNDGGLLGIPAITRAPEQN